MIYTALYRRWRPQLFADLKGQPHVARALSAAVRQGNFAHAYLFCGPRGTGKTSAARILARAVNCQRPTAAGEPCGLCPACLRALAGESMDLIEIDGASNRGIDEIRDLRERVKFAPAQERRKVYIIDEVHALTKDAFNALLKTLEEPPAHVIFIFATTAPHSLPLTVLSRCQRFDFRRISDQEIAEHLLAIAAAEQISLSAEAAALIARKAEGGMRDAVSLLDQCAGVGMGAAAGQVDVDGVFNLLGAVDRGFILELLHSLLARQTASALQQVDQLVRSGLDLRQAVDDLLEACRDCLLALLSREQSQGSELPPWLAHYPPRAYLDLLQALSDVDGRMRYSLSPRISLELALIKASGLPAAAVAGDAEGEAAPKHGILPGAAGQEDTKEPPAPRGNTAAPPLSAPATKAGLPGDTAPGQRILPGVASQENPQQPAAPRRNTAAPPPPSPAAEDSLAGAAVSIDAVREKWPEILAQVEAKNVGAYSVLREARPDRVDGRRLVLDFPPAMGIFISSVLNPSQYRTLIENAVNLALRSSLSLDGFIGTQREPDSDGEAAPEAETPTSEPVEQNLF